jgi:hypothetical protein
MPAIHGRKFTGVKAAAVTRLLQRGYRRHAIAAACDR